MTFRFKSPLAGDLQKFLQFQRSLGYCYSRAEANLRAFDRFLHQYASQRNIWHLDRAILDWIARKPQRKAISVSRDISMLRRFYFYLRRRPGHNSIREPLWPRLPVQSDFVPHIFSRDDFQQLLQLSSQLRRPPFRASLYRALLLLLYCTGIRFGEALRLRLRDVNTRGGLLWIDSFKGRARWVPFHRSLSRELESYLAARRVFASAQPDDRLFVGKSKRTLPVHTASGTLRRLFCQAGMKPGKGRIGPRPYDLRHTFAVSRLTQWYRRGVDLHARLPWLSAYMGHQDIMGTETYLTATPELLGLASNRFRRRYLTSHQERSRERE
jgi:integrase/recombinase XerD